MLFKVAKPTWGMGFENEKNITCGFYTKVCKTADKTIIRLATSGFYRLYINNQFVYYGPVRSAHGFYKVDEIPITEFLTEDVNHIAIEVVNYYINSYYYLKQSGFLQSEIESGGKIIAATDKNNNDFQIFNLGQRVRKMQRYSFQRPFAESYRLNPNSDLWRIGEASDAEPVSLEEVGVKRLLPRELPLHTFSKISPEAVIARGSVTVGDLPENLVSDRSLLDISDELEGYPLDELDFCLSYEVQTLQYTLNESIDDKYTGITKLSQGQYETMRFSSEFSGFPVMNINCYTDSTVYIMFDEVLDENNDINPIRVQCLNAIKLEMSKGNYLFEGFEPMGYKFLKVICIKGDVEISNICTREYTYPIPIKCYSEFDKKEEKIIFEAALQTFKQNASDLFTDCPTRERAGWLCDSFFIGRTERFFTGNNLMEKQFLENFLLPEKFEHIPDGMLPMCYPADHFNGGFIPNWAMWYALELVDYYNRTGDNELIKKARNRMEGLLNYFKTYENDDGLLEHLDGWVFVEWSSANWFVQDVNFPSNMTYSAMLKGLGELYSVPEWVEKGNKIADTIRKLSFDGEFFVDNQIYKDGKRVLSGEHTETCQYYAFFFDIATPETYPELWNRLTKDFGPNRKDNDLYPQIHHSNAFIGNYLRLDILLRYGLYDDCRNQIVNYFIDMARDTGTLWENMTSGASCNHGFASYVAYLLYCSAHKEKLM